jgi:PCFT/HCP family folate transporter-like MFS transporter 1/3
VLLSASLPSAVTGADLAIFAAVFSYVADVTTVESRTLRVTVLDITYLSTMPIGVALGILISCYNDKTDLFYNSKLRCFSS